MLLNVKVTEITEEEIIMVYINQDDKEYRLSGKNKHCRLPKVGDVFKSATALVCWMNK